MKNNKYISLIPIAVLVLGIIISTYLVPWLFKSQYNSKGISHWLIVTIDENQEREYIGKLDGYYVYVEGLKIDELNFRDVNAKNVPIKEAITKKLVSIDEFRKSAKRIKRDGDSEILINDNYEIVIAYGDCIIRPIN